MSLLLRPISNHNAWLIHYLNTDTCHSSHAIIEEELTTIDEGTEDSLPGEPKDSLSEDYQGSNSTGQALLLKAYRMAKQILTLSNINNH